MSYASLDDVMDLAERFLSYIASRVLETRQEELKTLERDTAEAGSNRAAVSARPL